MFSILRLMPSPAEPWTAEDLQSEKLAAEEWASHTGPGRPVESEPDPLADPLRGRKGAADVTSPRIDLLKGLEKQGTPISPPTPGAPEPFQVSAEAEQRLADLEKKKGLIEALQLIGTGAAQIGGRSAAVRAPDMTGEVNTAIAEQKDILPEAERAWLNQKFSLQLPRGITRTALNTMLPTIGRLTGGDKALEQKREMDLLRLQETNRRFGIRTEMTKDQKAVEVGLKFDTSPFVKGQKEAMISADKALAQLAANTSLSEMGALISLAPCRR